MDIRVENKTPLASAGVFLGNIYTVSQTTNAQKIRAFAFANQAGTLVIEQSVDGTTFRTTLSSATVASTGKIIEDMIVCPFVRIKFTNGATANTICELTSAIY